jgi:competence ComEA-like helix-hairpin-helix protein
METLTIRTRPARRRTLLRVALAALVLVLLAGVAMWLAPGADAAAWPGPRAAVRPPAAAKVKPGDPPPAPAPAPAEQSGSLNLNAATEEELMRLPGVGPSKAEAVVTWRKKYGSFKRVEDLAKVKGFGAKTLRRLKPFLSVSGATTYRPAGKKAGAGSGAAHRSGVAGGGSPAAP